MRELGQDQQHRDDRVADVVQHGAHRVPVGQPVVGEDRVVDVTNVIWCTGFRPDFSWIDLPIFDGKDQPKEPVHDRGVVPDAPGLYFVGLFFLYSMTSGLFTGVGRDAKYVVEHLASRERTARPAHADERSPSATSA